MLGHVTTGHRALDRPEPPAFGELGHGEQVSAVAEFQRRWHTAKTEYDDLTYERAVMAAAAERSAPPGLLLADLAAAMGISATALRLASAGEQPLRVPRPDAEHLPDRRRRAYYRMLHGITDVNDLIDWPAVVGFEIPAALTPAFGGLGHDEQVAAVAELQRRHRAAKTAHEELTYERAVLVAAAVRSGPPRAARRIVAAAIGMNPTSLSVICRVETPPGTDINRSNARRAYYRNLHRITDVIDPVDWAAHGGYDIPRRRPRPRGARHLGPDVPFYDKSGERIR